jgi:uncharacterized protein (DUF2236 family)
MVVGIEEHRIAVRDRLAAWGVLRSGPGSASWTVTREVVVIAGWGRAILLQLAHPLVGRGVAEHSSFRGGLRSGVARLSSTVGAMLALSFGTDDEAIDAAAAINAIHDRVSGSGYSAHDPELLRWVHATLLDSTPAIYERLVRPLSPADKDRYYAEAAVMEPLLGIPDGFLPRNSAQLDTYMRQMLDSGGIAVSDRSRMLGRAILFPPGWRFLWPVFRPLQLITIGLLPGRIREEYGFAWTPHDARALARWTVALRLLHRVLPRVVREWPASRRRRNRVSTFVPVKVSN